MKKLLIISLLALVCLSGTTIVSESAVVRKYTCTEWKPVDPNNPNSGVTRTCEVSDSGGCHAEQQWADCGYCPVEDTEYLGSQCGIINPE